MTSRAITLSLRWCAECQKLSYGTRKMARKAANEYTTHKTPYRCYVLPQFWHVGALPRAVIMGDMDRSFYYEGGPVAKDKGDQSGALGNKDSGKRGRGGDTVIGQTVPDKVKENLEKKGK